MAGIKSNGTKRSRQRDHAELNATDFIATDSLFHAEHLKLFPIELRCSLFPALRCNGLALAVPLFL
jgi:hypothetical protein